MGHDEPRLVDRLVAVEQQVEVDRPGAPLRPDPLAPEPPLDVEQVVEQAARREGGLDLGHRVEEAWLVLVPPGLRFAQLRQAGGSDQLRRTTDQRLPLAEVRAETDVSKGHGRSAVTALNSTASPAGTTSGLRTRTRTCSGANRWSSVSASDDASASSRRNRRSFTSRTVAATSV